MSMHFVTQHQLQNEQGEPLRAPHGCSGSFWLVATHLTGDGATLVAVWEKRDPRGSDPIPQPVEPPPPKDPSE